MKIRGAQCSPFFWQNFPNKSSSHLFSLSNRLARVKEKVLYLLDYNLEESLKYALSLHLKSHGFILIPISNESLDYFLSKGQKTILCLSNSMRSINEIQKLKKRYFKYALLNKKINLIEFSYSLNRDSIWGQLRNYHCYSLPIDFH